MPFNGSGVFSRVYSWATEALSPPIAVSKLDTQEEDIATALGNVITRDGQGKPSADIDWNAKKITNLADAAAATDALNRQTADARYLPGGSLATDRLLGRDTAGSGAPEAISLDSTLEFTGSAGIRRAALTGDVTASAGSNATTVANNAVTFAKMQDIGTNTLIGRSTAGTGDPESITCTAAGRALIDDADASAQRTTLGLGTAATQSSGAFAAASHTHGGGDITSAVANATNATNATTATGLANSTGSAPHYSCRAAGKFYWNGSSVVNSLGLNCSVSRIGVGQYRCTFSTNMADADYAVVFGGQQVAGNAYIITELKQGTSTSSSSFDMEVFNSGGNYDPGSNSTVSFAVFR